MAFMPRYRERSKQDTQFPVDPRSLMLRGPNPDNTGRIDPRSGVFTAPDAKNYGRNSFDRPWFEDANPRDRIQQISAKKGIVSRVEGALGDIFSPSKAWQPRGIRNNNPGNMEYSEKNSRGREGFAKAHGATGYGDKGRFASFPSPHLGIASIFALQKNYELDGKTTVAQRIGRWSPAAENGVANTKAYIKAVASAMGIDPNTPFSIKDPKLGNAFVSALIRHENGSMPYTPEQINMGRLFTDQISPSAQAREQQFQEARRGRPSIASPAAGANAVADIFGAPGELGPPPSSMVRPEGQATGFPAAQSPWGAGSEIVTNPLDRSRIADMGSNAPIPRELGFAAMERAHALQGLQAPLGAPPVAASGLTGSQALSPPSASDRIAGAFDAAGQGSPPSPSLLAAAQRAISPTPDQRIAGAFDASGALGPPPPALLAAANQQINPQARISGAFAAADQAQQPSAEAMQQLAMQLAPQASATAGQPPVTPSVSGSMPLSPMDRINGASAVAGSLPSNPELTAQLQERAQIGRGTATAGAPPASGTAEGTITPSVRIADAFGTAGEPSPIPSAIANAAQSLGERLQLGGGTAAPAPSQSAPEIAVASPQIRPPVDLSGTGSFGPSITASATGQLPEGLQGPFALDASMSASPDERIASAFSSQQKPLAAPPVSLTGEANAMPLGPPPSGTAAAGGQDPIAPEQVSLTGSGSVGLPSLIPSAAAAPLNTPLQLGPVTAAAGLAPMPSASAAPLNMPLAAPPMMTGTAANWGKAADDLGWGTGLTAPKPLIQAPPPSMMTSPGVNIDPSLAVPPGAFPVANPGFHAPAATAPVGPKSQYGPPMSLMAPPAVEPPAPPPVPSPVAAPEEGGWGIPGFGTIGAGIHKAADIGKRAFTAAGEHAIKTFAGAGPLERARLAAPAGRQAFMTAGMTGGTGPTTEMQLQALAEKLLREGAFGGGGGGSSWGGGGYGWGGGGGYYDNGRGSLGGLGGGWNPNK